MSDSKIPGFSETEIWTIQSTVDERFGKEVRLDLAETELRLAPEDRVLTPCPAVFWREHGANFVLCKVGETTYRCQFFYRGFEQYGTGRETYDDLAQCVVTLLQVQADHARARAERGPTPQPQAPAPEAGDDRFKPSTSFGRDR